MSRHVKSLAYALTISTLIATGCSPKAGQVDADGKTQFRDLIPGMRIVYSANIDGEIEPCGCRSNPTGGVHRRWNLMKEKLGGEKLQLDSGDLFYQSMPVPPFLERQWNYQATVLLKAYNAYGVEVMAPGELDFAAGLAQFEKLRAGAKFKIISANIFRKGETTPLLNPYVIVTKGGRKIGIFGLYDETLPLPPELEARDHVAAARAAVVELRKKADIVIALTHLGLEKDMLLAKAVGDIDAIFGAHTQSFLIEPEKVGDTIIFQPSFRGQHLGTFKDGKNSMYQVDERFESPAGTRNPMDVLLADAKAEIARINKEQEAEMFGNAKPQPAIKKEVTHFQTFPKCAECHAPQYDFYKGTAHAKAYETLVRVKQAANLDCLKCHTVGMQKPGGWTSVNKLVLNNTGKAIDAASFAKSFHKMDMPSLAKVSKAFINVQCENCHGAGNLHPLSVNGDMNKITTTTCLQCHTADRAPEWYKNGKLNEELVAAKLKSVSCPPLQKP